MKTYFINIADRIKSTLGEGTFGKVLRCKDLETLVFKI